MFARKKGGFIRKLANFQNYLAILRCFLVSCPVVSALLRCEGEDSNLVGGGFGLCLAIRDSFDLIKFANGRSLPGLSFS